MKAFQSSIFRAIVAIVVGILLAQFRGTAATWLVIAVGALFLISGLISCATFFRERHAALTAGPLYDIDGKEYKRRTPSFPLIGIGSVLLGFILVVMPATFLAWFGIFLAVLLIIGGISQIVSLAAARQYAYVPVLFWIFPVVTLIVGIITLANPSWPLTTILLITGWCFIFYGIVELINSIKIHQMRKAHEKAEEAKIVKASRMPDDDIEDAEIVE